jgi:uncharacterized protein YndB with AHSA1/START domain
MERHATVTAHVAAPPAAVYELLSDIERLTEWNDCIEALVEMPSAFETGAQWVVRMHVAGMGRWDSRSTVQELDQRARRFVHRTQTDDGNPSYAIWTWQVDDGAGGGSTVTVTWSLNPKTRFRRWIAARMRHRQLRGEVARSLAKIPATLGLHHAAG